MSNYIHFKDNEPDNITDTWNNMVKEVKSSYLLPPTKKKVCVDIGSNIGSFMAYAHSCGAFEEIYGFEPAFQTYHASLSMLKHFDILSENVQVRNLAVTDQTGQMLRLFDCGDGESGSATLLRKDSSTQEELCLTIGLDDIFDILGVNRINYLKMDCEGAEFNVLAGCRRLQDIDAMMVETHEDQGMQTWGPIRDLLVSKGFYVVDFKNRGETDCVPLLFAINCAELHEDLREYYGSDGEGNKLTVGDLEREMMLQGKPPLDYEECVKDYKDFKERGEE